MTKAQASNALLYFLFALLSAVMAFSGKQIISNDERITTIEERVPVDLKARLQHIQDGVDALTRTASDGTSYQRAGTYSR